MSEKVVRKPFHESVISVIENMVTADEIDLVVFLIEKTKIPKNHDAIIAALSKRWPLINAEEKERFVPGFLVDLVKILVEQKQEAEVEAEAKKQKPEEKK